MLKKLIDTTLRYKPYPGNDSKCRVRIYTGEAHGATILITELPDNDGMSITNASELIASEVCRRYDLRKVTTRWIEHYPAAAWRESNRPETFDEIRFMWDGYTASAPRWHRLTVEEVETLTGETWDKGNLTDDTDRIAKDLGFEWVQDDWQKL